MTRDDLIEHLRPLIDEFVAEVAEMLWRQLEERLQASMSAALSVLASFDADEAEPQIELEDCPPDVPVAPPVARTPRGHTAGARRCSACGETGHRRPQCPTLSTKAEAAPLPDVAEPDDDDEREEAPSAPATRATTRDRYAAIESAAKARRAAVLPEARSTFDLP